MRTGGNVIDSDEGLDVEAHFVGRTHELKELKTRWKEYRIFGVFGLRCVGKSRLVCEFRKRYLKHEQVISIDCRFYDDIITLYTNLCIHLNIEVGAEDLDSAIWIAKIVNVLQRNYKTQYVIVFDNTEDYQDMSSTVRRSIFTLCTQLVTTCFNVKVIVTSTTRVQFAQLRKLYFWLEVPPLNNDDARELLQSELEGTGLVLEEYANTIISLTEGIPIVILMVASELKEDGGMITPKDMVELLAKGRLKTLSREFYPKEDRIADVYRTFLNRLTKVYQTRMTVLDFIPGSFTAKEAQEMLGFSSEALAKGEFLIPVRGRHYLRYDKDTKRFSMQGFLRECIRIYFTVENIPEIRTRYIHTFCHVITQIAKELCTDKHCRARDELALELPNLQKLLTEAKHLQAETYKFYIKMVTDCTKVIEEYLVGEADTFYECCLKAADTYGQDLDKAVVNIAVGSFLTTIKAKFAQGAERLETAMQILERLGRKTVEHATAHDQLGWNLKYQGRYEEAIRHLDESLNISSTAGRDFKMISLQSMERKGTILADRGRFREAEMYLLSTLEQRRRLQGNEHSDVGKTLNSLGFMFDRKGDKERSLEYFEEAVIVKRKSKAPELSIASSLTNLARTFGAAGRLKEAHLLLKEVDEILKKQKVYPGDRVAYLYESRALAYRREGKHDEAREMIEQAVGELRLVSETSPQYLAALYFKAVICLAQKKYKASVKAAEDAIKLARNQANASPRFLFFRDCLHCQMLAFKELGDMSKYQRCLRQLESELMQVERELDESNEIDYHKIRMALKAVQTELGG